MSQAPSPNTDPSTSGQDSATQSEPSASKDLADGLDLMLRAARKAVRHVEPARLEELGRRALKSLEQLDSGGIGRKAAQALDRRKIEDIAHEAGKEIMGVVERVAERMEAMVHSKRGSTPPAGSEAKTEGADASSGNGADAPESHPRIRVNDDR